MITSSKLTTLDPSPIGTIKMHGGGTAPTGYLICNGALCSTSTYASLFAVIGYAFGSSGATFQLPDFGGISPIGSGAGNTKLSDLLTAGARAYNAALGTYYQCVMQGSKGEIRKGATRWGESTDYQTSGGPSSGIRAAGNTIDVITVTDGINGTPSTDAFTRGPSVGVTFIIKY